MSTAALILPLFGLQSSQQGPMTGAVVGMAMVAVACICSWPTPRQIAVFLAIGFVVLGFQLAGGQLRDIPLHQLGYRQWSCVVLGVVILGSGWALLKLAAKPRHDPAESFLNVEPPNSR